MYDISTRRGQTQAHVILSIVVYIVLDVPCDPKGLPRHQSAALVWEGGREVARVVVLALLSSCWSAALWGRRAARL